MLQTSWWWRVLGLRHEAHVRSRQESGDLFVNGESSSYPAKPMGIGGDTEPFSSEPGVESGEVKEKQRDE